MISAIVQTAVTSPPAPIAKGRDMAEAILAKALYGSNSEAMALSPAAVQMMIIISADSLSLFCGALYL